MKNNDQQNEKKLLLLVAGLALAGLFAVLLKKLISLPDKEEPGFDRKKMHCYLRLRKKTIEKYINAGGRAIKFEFIEDKKRVKLDFVGYDENGREFYRRKIDTIYSPDIDVPLENREFGVFKEDKNGRLLHNIFTEEPVHLWNFKPVPCELPNGEGYVSYDVSAEALLLVYRINPCPPGCNEV